MKREDAIKMFGHHFYIGGNRITERLGPAPEDDKFGLSFAGFDNAYASLDEKVRTQARKDLDGARQVLNWTSTKILVARARRGWHKNSEAILKSYDSLKAREQKAREHIENGIRGACAIHNLPDDIRMPVALEPGQIVYQLRMGYLLNPAFADYAGNEGLSVRELRITGRRLYECSGNDKRYDYTFGYTAKADRAHDFSFSYDHDDLSVAEISTNHSGLRYFLTREAADDAVLEAITHLTENFNMMARQVAERRGQTPVAQTRPEGPMF